LTVKNISMVAGSSNLFTLQKVPTLPTVIERDARIAIDVQFRAESMVTASGFVSVETDDVMRPFAEATLRAFVGPCASSCPITNGTPSCAMGTCAIGMCNTGWYDTDGQASSGCECQEPPGSGPDPGDLCASKNHLGRFSDEGSGSQYTGIIALTNDVDLVSFTGIDETQFFSDDYDVKIRLDSADPGIRMCVYRNGGANLPGTCFLSGETCPSNRFYRHDGSLGPEDGSDYVVKIFRDPQSPATCTPYTLFVSNAR
ncbi:MAG: hypothetical protein JNK82_08535, partial [Myxococcaceae bacterium]|nr:hypothetical protein [Myxococcaceae bacterium]